MAERNWMQMRNAVLVSIVFMSLAVTCGFAVARVHQDEDPPRLAFVTNGVASFWVIAEKGAQDAGTKTGAEVSVHMPPAGISDQKRILEDLMVKRVDGIAVSPIDPANQTRLLDQVAKRTNLITHDSDAPDSKRLCYIGMDNYAAGRMCGELVKETLPNGGKIAIFIGRLEQDNARRRRQGVIDSVLGRSNDPSRYDKPGAPLEGGGFTIVGTYTDQFDRAKGKANAEDVLSRHPDIDGMVGLFAYNPPLILEALKGAGKTGEVKVIAFDEDDVTLDGIESGSVSGTIVQNPYMYGFRSIEVLDALSRGDRSVIPANGMIDIPARKITSQNVKAFRKDLNEKVGKDKNTS